MSSSVSKIAVVGASILSLALLSSTASAQGKISWKMQSAFASSLPHLGPGGTRFSKDIERMSGGQFDVKFFEPGQFKVNQRGILCRFYWCNSKV